jgi:hypothetical protein
MPPEQSEVGYIYIFSMYSSLCLFEILSSLHIYIEAIDINIDIVGLV